MTSPRSMAKGSVLVEFLMAILLLAVVASVFAGTMLQGTGQTQRLRDREQGLLAANQVLQALQSYVTADPSAATQSMAPGGCWNLIDPSAGSCPSGWALDPGVHDATFLLPNSLTATPYNGTLTYTVTWPTGVVPPNGTPAVDVSANWTEPST